MDDKEKRLVSLYIGIIRNFMEDMTDEERFQIIEQLLDGYCEHCGGSAPCSCWNDD